MNLSKNKKAQHAVGLFPDNLKSSLPTIEEIEDAIQ